MTQAEPPSLQEVEVMPVVNNWPFGKVATFVVNLNASPDRMARMRQQMEKVDSLTIRTLSVVASGGLSS